MLEHVLAVIGFLVVVKNTILVVKSIVDVSDSSGNSGRYPHWNEVEAEKE